jgi:hypothetical protein
VKSERKPNPDAFYWTCLVPEHRHKSQQAAEKCISAVPPKAQRRWTIAMYEECQSMRSAGATLSAIGERYGVTGSRIRIVLAMAPREIRKLQFFAVNPNASLADWYAAREIRKLQFFAVNPNASLADWYAVRKQEL